MIASKSDHSFNTKLMPSTDPRSNDLSELLGHVHNCWDNERRSLSRQLHDSLGSSLTALTMHLGLLMQKLPCDPALLERANHMKQLLQQVVETNRQMQLQLWNDKLEFLGLRVAVSEVVARFGEQHGVHSQCSLPDEDINCPRGHNVVVLHTLEEALRNVAAHARASEVEVIVDDNDEAIMLTVKDNGVGVHGAAPAASGKYGLRLLRERAAYLGGSLTLLPRSDGGSVLTMTLPKPATA